MPFAFRPLLARAMLGALALLFASNAQADDRPVRPEAFFLEAGLGGSGARHDAYVERLERFRFEPPRFGMFGDLDRLSHTLTAGYMLHKNLGLLLRHELLEERTLVRYLTDAKEDEFGWTSRAFSLGVRGRHPFLREWFAVYGQAQLGIGVARSHYQNHGQPTHRETYRGVSFGLSAGLDVNFFKYGGMFVEAGYTRAPLLENRFGETHDDGGFNAYVGVRVRTFGEP